jgi:hypothetical protein
MIVEAGGTTVVAIHGYKLQRVMKNYVLPYSSVVMFCSSKRLLTFT